MIESYRDLVAWQRAMQLVEVAYRLAGALPPEERFALASQIRRAAVSIPSNVGVGHARGSTREYLRFLSIALGSLAELETLMELAARLYPAVTVPESTLSLADEVGRIIRGLCKSLEARLPATS